MMQSAMALLKSEVCMCANLGCTLSTYNNPNNITISRVRCALGTIDWSRRAYRAVVQRSIDCQQVGNLRSRHRIVRDSSDAIRLGRSNLGSYLLRCIGQVNATRFGAVALAHFLAAVFEAHDSLA
jgi:hypothetical protein